MNSNIHDIDKIRRIEDIGFYYEDGLKYSAKLFIYLEYPRYARFRFVPAHIESI